MNHIAKVYKQYEEDVLSNHEMGSFVVKKELSLHPAVPEFNCNSAEVKQFIDTIGNLNSPNDFTVNQHGGEKG